MGQSERPIWRRSGGGAPRTKLAFVLPNLSAGGAERVTLNFMRQLDPAQVDVTLLVLDATSDLRHLVPEHVRFVDLKTVRASRSLGPLLLALRRLKPTFVFATHSRMVVLLALIAKVERSFALLARVPSMPSLERREGYTKPAVARVYAWAYGRASRVLVQTDAMKEDVHTSYRISRDRIVVAHNPMDKSLIDELADHPSPFESSRVNIVASGRHSREKGFDVLLRALPKVLEQVPDAHLTILGSESNQTEELKSIASQLDLSRHVTFHGFTTNPYSYYQHADLFVLSSRWEGFPNALLENYYLNTPIAAVVCVPIVRDLVKNGINGQTTDDLSPESLSRVIVSALAGVPRDSVSNPPYHGYSLGRLLGNRR